MKKQAICPNCGLPIDAIRDQAEFVCDHCGEVLAVSVEGKIVMAHPAQTYADPSFQARSEGRKANPLRRNQISAARRIKSTELALERTFLEKDRALKGFVYGILLMVFGGLLTVLTFLRNTFLFDDWLNLIGFGLGLIFIPLGAYITIWFTLTSRAKDKEEAEIIREREAIDKG